MIEASSLVERIEARRRLAAAEREFLVARIDALQKQQEDTILRIAETRARADSRREVLERIAQHAYRAARRSPLEVLLARGSVLDVVVHLDGLAALSEQERDLVLELREIGRRLGHERDALATQHDELGALAEAVSAKDALLERLAARAEKIAAVARRGKVVDAEIESVRALAEEAARTHEETEKLVAEIARRSGIELPKLDAWMWPALGPMTQPFGPTTLTLEPPRVYGGTAYPHFHDGLDIAAALGTPVRAAASGRVAYVGHLPDGAMLVVIAHDAGYVSLYGHLDDVIAPPTVRAGVAVTAGQVIGHVGLSGLTTGPHLHFVVRKLGEPIDPRALLPIR